MESNPQFLCELDKEAEAADDEGRGTGTTGLKGHHISFLLLFNVKRCFKKRNASKMARSHRVNKTDALMEQQRPDLTWLMCVFQSAVIDA